MLNLIVSIFPIIIYGLIWLISCWFIAVFLIFSSFCLIIPSIIWRGAFDNRLSIFDNFGLFILDLTSSGILFLNSLMNACSFTIFFQFCSSISSVPFKSLFICSIIYDLKFGSALVQVIIALCIALVIYFVNSSFLLFLYLCLSFNSGFINVS